MPNTKKQEEIYCPYEDMTIANHFEAVIGKIALSKIPETPKNQPFIDAYKDLLEYGVEAMAIQVVRANSERYKSFSWNSISSRTIKTKGNMPIRIRRRTLAKYFSEELLDYKILNDFESGLKYIWIHFYLMAKNLDIDHSLIRRLKRFATIAFYRKCGANIVRAMLKNVLRSVERFFANSSISTPDPKSWWLNFLSDSCYFYLNYRAMAQVAYRFQDEIFGEKSFLIENILFLSGQYSLQYKTTLDHIQKELLRTTLLADDTHVADILFASALEAFPGIAKPWVYQRYNVFVDEAIDTNLWHVIKDKREQIINGRRPKRNNLANTYKHATRKWHRDWLIPKIPSKIVLENSDGIRYKTIFQGFKNYSPSDPIASNPHFCSRASYWEGSSGDAVIATGGVSIYKVCKSVLDGTWESPHLNTKDKIIHIDDLPENFESDYKEYVRRFESIAKTK